ncbi:glycolipid transfer protein 3-like [Ziziphus jujuba]|uniref:Glycolipid transfer protein 3-like n=1 Tax=Ziziphus jujuba TaxID=326968 RepID=A0ABM3IMJ0_ZIZJJ|nr:glycolipid transfer protein 3-like [Ziziphus jujuba]
MKRKREMESSEIRSAIEELSKLAKLKPGCDDNHDDALHIPTMIFISVCNFVLQVLDKIGPTMAVLRQDIHQNIQRVELVRESDPSKFSNLVEILKKEAIEGNSRKTSSCSRALVWLTRSLDFTVALLQKLTKGSGQKMEKIVEDCYNITLKPWHGWISLTAVKVALKLVPDQKTLMDYLMAKDGNLDTLKEEMQTFVTLLAPFLENIHSTLRSYRVDRLKST